MDLLSYATGVVTGVTQCEDDSVDKDDLGGIHSRFRS